MARLIGGTQLIGDCTTKRHPMLRGGHSWYSWYKNRKTGILKIQFYVSSGTFSAFFLKTENFRNLIGLWARKFRHSCQNCILSVQKHSLGDEINRKVFHEFIYSFWTLSEKFRSSEQNTLCRVDKTALQMSRGTIWEKQRTEKKVQQLREKRSSRCIFEAETSNRQSSGQKVKFSTSYKHCALLSHTYQSDSLRN